MNVFRATLVFICFVAAKGSFPAVIFRRMHILAQPEILPLPDAEVEIGFEYRYIASQIACPLDPSLRETDAIPDVLVWHEIVSERKIFNLDELSFCKLQPQVTFERTFKKEDYSWYRIGYKVYFRKEKEKDDNGDSILYSSRDEHTIGEVFRVNFNTVTKQTISVEHELHASKFISTASNKKHTFVYEKNEEFLGIDLDFLYKDFVDQILPQMVTEKSANQLAHALGIQKVQLAPKDDFLLDTWKTAAYWNINTVPIWRVLLLRWNAIEIYLRKLHKRDIDMYIETGASGTLELAEGYYQKNIHIPKYLWKVIPTHCNEHNIMILIIMHNDPFTEHQEPLCEDICAINGWLVSNNDYRTGLVYCCKMNAKIAQILDYSDDMRFYESYSFTRNEVGMEDLDKISLILSDPRKKLYDW